MLAIESYVYETGAVLGQLYRRDKVLHLAKLLAQPGMEQTALGHFQERAESDYDSYRETFGDCVLSISVMAMALFYKRLDIVMPITPDLFTNDKQRKQTMKKIRKLTSEKIVGDKSLGPFGEGLQMTLCKGVGFGSLWPEWTEELYRENYEQIDWQTVEDAKRHGLKISDDLVIVTLEEREDSLLEMIANFTHAYRPDLVYLVDIV